jgi:aerobic-type carbon monoxide dehydrogenase small subunit (CoxS/CutS family)
MPQFTITINGEQRMVEAADTDEFLYVLRDVLGVTGPKYGCGVGVCGACTSHVADPVGASGRFGEPQAFRPCITPTGFLDGKGVTTIEGLAPSDDVLHPVQQAWIDEDVAQCGFCQAGQIMTAVDLLNRIPDPTDEDIDREMSDNVCRCGTYYRIRLAIKRAAAGGGPMVQRFAGAERVETSVAISRAAFEDGAASTVVLSVSDAFPDALAGAPLAASAGGPVLITPSDALAPATAAEMARVLPPGGTVHLLGGTEALSDAVATSVQALGFTTVRLAGADRQATAAAIAPIAGPAPARIFLASGDSFGEALIASSTAARTGGVVLLTGAAGLPAEAQSYLDAHPGVPVTVVGNAAAATVGSLGQVVAGADAYATSVAMAEAFSSGMAGIALASGEDFPDALAGGAHAARGEHVLLLTRKGTLPASVRGFLSGSGMRSLIIYGGDAAVDGVVAEAARAAMSR